MMLKSTESVSETDQEVVSDKHLMTLTTPVLRQGRTFYYSHILPMYLLVAQFFLFTLENIQKFSYFLIILYRIH